MKSHKECQYLDVVIPVHSKDLGTLNHCIEGVKKNIKNVRRIITVSKEPYTDKAEWFDEAKFPFLFEEVNKILNGMRTGWHLQQLLKLYAAFVIPDISENVLIVDSDTVFFRKVNMFSRWRKLPYINLGKKKEVDSYATRKGYIKHMHSVLPELGVDDLPQKYQGVSGICHNMLFQKHVLEDLFKRAEANEDEGLPFWRICLKHSTAEGESDLSEYEMYFNFLLHFHKNKFKIRRLRFKNTSDFRNIEKYKKRIKYHYCSFHTHMR